MFTLTRPAPAVNFDSPAVEARPAPEPTGPTAADDLWWAEETRDDSEPTGAEWDDLADASAAVDSLCLGYCHA